MTTLSRAGVIRAAADLLCEPHMDGTFDDSEYDRAISELTSELIGEPLADAPRVLDALRLIKRHMS